MKVAKDERVIELYEAIKTGKPIIAVDQDRIGSMIIQIPRDTYIYDEKTHTICAFSMKNVDKRDLFKKNIYITAEFHFPENSEAKERHLMKEFLGNFILRHFDSWYIAREGEINSINYPARPIMHMVMEDVRSWFYDALNGGG